VKQQLAAIRMVFDYLVLGYIVPANPAAAVRCRSTPRIAARGKTQQLCAAFSAAARGFVSSPVRVSHRVGDRAVA
jgi:hypothetical protein